MLYVSISPFFLPDFGRFFSTCTNPVSSSKAVDIPNSSSIPSSWAKFGKSPSAIACCISGSSKSTVNPPSPLTSTSWLCFLSATASSLIIVSIITSGPYLSLKLLSARATPSGSVVCCSIISPVVGSLTMTTRSSIGRPTFE